MASASRDLLCRSPSATRRQRGGTSCGGGAIDPPPGFRFSEVRGGPIVVEWGEHGWAEFFGTRVLVTALTFAWLMLADPDDVAASARSADGAPLMERGSMPDAAGPTGDPTVRSWKNWLAEREGTADV